MNMKSKTLLSHRYIIQISPTPQTRETLPLILEQIPSLLNMRANLSQKKNYKITILPPSWLKHKSTQQRKLNPSLTDHLNLVNRNSSMTFYQNTRKYAQRTFYLIYRRFYDRTRCGACIKAKV